MNKYARTMFCLPVGIIKVGVIKLLHFNNFKGSPYSVLSPFSEISLDYGGKLIVDKKFRIRDGTKVRVRKGAKCQIGNNVSINCNNMIACRENIIIGDHLQFSTNVQIYAHDYKANGGIGAMKYLTSSV